MARVIRMPTIGSAILRPRPGRRCGNGSRLPPATRPDAAADPHLVLGHAKVSDHTDEGSPETERDVAAGCRINELGDQLCWEAERWSAPAWDHPEACLQACCTRSPVFWLTC